MLLLLSNCKHAGVTWVCGENRYNFTGFSWNSIFGIFMIMTTDPDLSRKVFSYNDKDTLLMGVRLLTFTSPFQRKITAHCNSHILGACPCLLS